MFEGDAQLIVKEVNSEDPYASKCGHFVEGIKSLFKGFKTTSFFCVIIKANNVAHRLAKMATTHVTDNTWLENAPSDICNIVQREESISSL
jgi:hypothetical protein